MVITPTGGALSIRHSAANRDAADSSTSGVNMFAEDLAAALEKYLAESGNGSRIEIGIEAASGDGERQFIVTVKDAPTQQITPVAEQTPVLAPSQMLMYSGTVQYVPSTAAAEPAKPANEVDAYWAMQPPEVQELRTIKDEAAKNLKAKELADSGFAIDVPIMLWNWDPLMTMRARETAGYTWVPSANQAPVELGPGLSFPGMKPYDPGNPPPGSIRVTTEFARGLEHTSAWWRGAVLDAPDAGINPES